MLKINADMSVTVDETDTIAFNDLRAKVAARVESGNDVFVDFGDGVPWSDVLHTVDTLRGFNENVHVAVRVREDSEVSQ